MLSNHLPLNSDQSFEFGAIVDDHAPNRESAHNAECECHDVTCYSHRQTCRDHQLSNRSAGETLPSCDRDNRCP
jgi:hypothetical protein